MKEKKQKKEYVTPVVTVFSARIEKGYQLSHPDGSRLVRAILTVAGRRRWAQAAISAHD